MAQERFQSILMGLQKDLYERLEYYEKKYQMNSENFLHQYEKHGFIDLSDNVRVDMHRGQIFYHALTKIFPASCENKTSLL